MKKLFSQKGFSLLELLLSLGIIALIILMATRYFTTARNAQLVSATVQQIQGVRSAASTLLAQGVTPTVGAICAAAAIPTSYCSAQTTSGQLITPFDSTGSADNDFQTVPTDNTTTLFILQYDFPSTAICQAVLNAFTQDLDASGSSGCGTNGKKAQLYFKK